MPKFNNGHTYPASTVQCAFTSTFQTIKSTSLRIFALQSYKWRPNWYSPLSEARAQLSSQLKTSLEPVHSQLFTPRPRHAQRPAKFDFQNAHQSPASRTTPQTSILTRRAQAFANLETPKGKTLYTSPILYDSVIPSSPCLCTAPRGHKPKKQSGACRTPEEEAAAAAHTGRAGGKKKKRGETTSSPKQEARSEKRGGSINRELVAHLFAQVGIDRAGVRIYRGARARDSPTRGRAGGRGAHTRLVLMPPREEARMAPV